MAKRKINPRRILIILTPVLFVVLLSLLIYAFVIEPYWLEVTYQKVDVIGGDDTVKIRIGLIADMHVASEADKQLLGRAIDELNKLDTDFVVLAGDLVDSSKDQIPFLEPLLRIENDQAFVVLGNHDYGPGYRDIALADAVAAWLEERDFTVLRNEHVIRRIRDLDVCIIGVDSLWANQLDLDEAYANIDQDCVKILLSHNPDVIFGLEKEADLILSGHTHGSQVCVPLIDWAPFKVSQIQNERCGRGLYEVNGRKIFITKGLASLLGVRFNSRPEVAVLEMV